MKKILNSQAWAIIFFFALSFFLGTALMTNAQVMPENAVNTDMTERMEAREGQREERRAMLEQNLQDRIVNLATNVAGRFTSAINRMENIIDRLESRIEKMKDSGIDTTEAEAKLSEAKATAEGVRDALQDLPSVQNAVSGDSPREAFTEIRMQFMVIHGLLRQTHANLRDVVTLLKQAIAGATDGQGVSDAVRNNN